MTPVLVSFVSSHQKTSISWKPTVPRDLEKWKKTKFTSSNEFLLLIGVDEKAFSQNFLNLDDRDFPQWSSHDKVLNLLLIRMTKSITHEDAATVSHNKIIHALIAKRGSILICWCIGGVQHARAQRGLKRLILLTCPGNFSMAVPKTGRELFSKQFSLKPSWSWTLMYASGWMDQKAK